jgi:hypothetical protein
MGGGGPGGVAAYSALSAPAPPHGFPGQTVPIFGGRCGGGSWVGGRLWGGGGGRPPRGGPPPRRTTALAAAGVPSLDTN